MSKKTGDKHEYAQLLTEQYSDVLEEECDVPFSPEKNETTTIVQLQKKASRTRGFLPIAVACVVSLVIGVLLGAMIPEFRKHSLIAHFRTYPSTSYTTTQIVNGVEIEGTQCGSTWEEAKAMGCKFDVMASRWYAPDCFFQEVLDGMMAEPWVNFTWYADEDHTEVFPSEKAMTGEFVHVYPDDIYHAKHCLYLWRVLHWAVLTNRPVDEDILKWGHTLHCTRRIMQMLAPGYGPETKQASAANGRPFCRRATLGFQDGSTA